MYDVKTNSDTITPTGFYARNDSPRQSGTHDTFSLLLHQVTDTRSESTRRKSQTASDPSLPAASLLFNGQYVASPAADKSPGGKTSPRQDKQQDKQSKG